MKFCDKCISLSHYTAPLDIIRDMAPSFDGDWYQKLIQTILQKPTAQLNSLRINCGAKILRTNASTAMERAVKLSNIFERGGKDEEDLDNLEILEK